MFLVAPSHTPVHLQLAALDLGRKLFWSLCELSKEDLPVLVWHPRCLFCFRSRDLTKGTVPVQWGHLDALTFLNNGDDAFR
eukprot:3420428-Rhodomonas_salina.5